jgi:hypothetical protein
MHKFSSETNLEKHLEIEKANSGHSSLVAEMAHEQRGRAPAGRPSKPALLPLCSFCKRDPEYSLTTRSTTYTIHMSLVFRIRTRERVSISIHTLLRLPQNAGNKGGGWPAQFRPAGSPLTAREGPVRAEVP